MSGKKHRRIIWPSGFARRAPWCYDALMSDTEPNNPQPMFVDAFEARYLGRTLRRHGVVVILCTLLGAAVGAGWSLLSPPVYRAEAVLLVNIQTVRIGADGIPLEVELVPPTRRTVGTICQSDAVMLILSARLAGEPDPVWPGVDELAEMVSEIPNPSEQTRPTLDLHKVVYFDQLSQEMAALRAVANDPVEAARIANVWAGICRKMLVMAYGSLVDELNDAEARIEQASREVLEAKAARAQLPGDASDAQRLTCENAIDQAQRYLAELNQRYAVLKVRLADSDQIARIVSDAVPPSMPINASTNLIAGLFGVAGFLFGLAITLFRGPGSL